eukprot:5070002-Pyramimonas_sp.AAC.1
MSQSYGTSDDMVLRDGCSSMPVLTDRLLHLKEKASKDYMQLSNPPGQNALQVVDADGHLHVIY